ncbi:MAG TPA: prepilin-type N-terminal cleavage/methylation domain-containing protein [Steroidobacteraceae bacterium]|nr:prepilin-type N-terminal cleavage/methylation domain-containing protein [Steroidobacteraceae bacterium]
MAPRIATGSVGRRGRPAFTLIELLVVMSIIATLLLIAVPRYFHSVDHSREVVLRQDLSVMRDAIDKHFADLARYPDVLPDLVERHYLRSIPVDPETKSSESWVTVPSEDQEAPGIRDVHSGSQATASDGTAFATW